MANTTDPAITPIHFAGLKDHLETQYDIVISRMTQLDRNVFRIDRQDGLSWVARIFNSSTPIQIVEGNAEILLFLEQQSFPAERCASFKSVSATLSGNHILVTEFVEGRRPRKGEQLFPRLGDLLGRLHSLETGNAGALARRGGAWHHICQEGGPKEELRAALALLKEAKKEALADELELYQKLQTKIGEMDDFEDLQQAFIHPDFVPSNVIIAGSGDAVIVDWAGAGTGPRVSSLGFLLWAAGNRSMAQVEAVAKAYSKHVSLTEGELVRLADAVWFRPLVLRCWEVCTGRKKLEDVMKTLPQLEELTERIVSVTCKAFEEGGGCVS